MSMNVNQLIQEACEEVSLVMEGEKVDDRLAASAEGLLNTALSELNSDGFIALSTRTHDLSVAGNVEFRRLEEGEERKPNVVDEEPPDSIEGVSRQVGIRWFSLRPSNLMQIDRTRTAGFPQFWSYDTFEEEAPSGERRRVGRVTTNGSAPVQLRIYENSAFPNYRLGDTIYLSPLYRTLILYALEMKLVGKYKLYSYEQKTQVNLTKAMKSIDTISANNKPLVNGAEGYEDYLSPYFNLVGGQGL